MKNNNKFYERCMFNQINQYLQYVFAHTTRAIFGSPYFNQSLKFLGGFIVGTMAHILGPRKLTN